jgi:hypothetical protein
MKMKKLLAACTAALRAMGLAGGRASSLTSRHATGRPRLTKVIAGSTTAVLAIGLAVVGVAAPATATAQPTNSVSSTCSALTVDLSGYTAGQAAVDAVPATDGQPYIAPTYKTVVVTPAVPAVTHIEIQFTFKNENNPNSPRWEPEGWNSESNPESLGWHQTDTRVVTDTPAVPEVTQQVIDNPGQPYIAPTAGTPAVLATTNHVTVTIGGVGQASTDFPTSYLHTFPFADSTSAHSWNVTVTTADDSVYTFDGPSTPCATPEQPTATPAGCDTETGNVIGGYITIPATEGVKYQIDEVAAGPGDHDATPGAHTVTAQADTGFTLEGVSSWPLTVGATGDCFIPVQAAAATPSAEVCGYDSGTLTSGYITIPAAEHVTFKIDGVTYAAGKHEFANGDHTVTVTAGEGYVLVGNASYKVTIDGAGECLTPVTPGDPTAQNQACDLVGGVTDGYITVGELTNVDYTIDGVPVLTVKTTAAPGEHTVVATAKNGYRLVGVGNEVVVDGHITWPLTVAEASLCDFNPPTLALLTASASATNQVCNAGSTTSGFISVVFFADDPSAVQYFIGDRELTTANTAVAPGTYTVTAVPRDPNDTIDGTSTWTLTVAAVGTVCGELTTLAFTGVNGNNLGGMLMLGMFLLIGGAGVYTSTRVRIRKN